MGRHSQALGAPRSFAPRRLPVIKADRSTAKTEFVDLINAANLVHPFHTIRHQNNATFKSIVTGPTPHFS
jgi:hypothetical protein